MDVKLLMKAAIAGLIVGLSLIITFSVTNSGAVSPNVNIHPDEICEFC